MVTHAITNAHTRVAHTHMRAHTNTTVRVRVGASAGLQSSRRGGLGRRRRKPPSGIVKQARQCLAERVQTPLVARHRGSQGRRVRSRPDEIGQLRWELRE